MRISGAMSTVSPRDVKSSRIGNSTVSGIIAFPACAETIENNVRKLIIEENPINPKYYDRMSQLLDELIAARRSQAIAYQAYLDKIVDLTRQAKNPHAGGSYPATVDTPARKALYDNLDSDEALTLAVDEAVHESRQDDWRGNRMKQKRVKLAIRSVLGESDPRVDDVFDLVTNQNEY